MEDTRFINEILAQAAALRDVAAFSTTPAGHGFLRIASDILRERSRIIFTGMGTSLHAPYLILRELMAIPPTVEVRDAGELLHFGLAGIRPSDGIVAVSQSGESAETRAVVGALEGRVPIVSVVNDPGSFMAAHANILLPLHAGAEASISAKTYTNTLAVLMFLSDALTGADIDRTAHLLCESADGMERAMEHLPLRAQEAADGFGDIRALHAIARGSDLVTAYQLALIIKEGAGTPAEALSAGLFRHGPLELAGPGHSAVLFLSEGNEPGLTASLARDLSDAGSAILAVADSPDYDLGGIDTVVIEAPERRIFPILCAPFIELFVHETARRTGREAGVFRRISKITARE